MTNGAWEQRLIAVEKEVAELRELVDGQESWSHRKRLHELEGDAHAAVLARDALDAYRETRDKTTTRVREWSSFVIATAALVYGFLH